MEAGATFCNAALKLMSEGRAEVRAGVCRPPPACAAGFLPCSVILYPPHWTSCSPRLNKLQVGVNGDLVLTSGYTSCHQLRQALNLPGHLPLVVFSSARNLPAGIMGQLINFFTTSDCDLLSHHRDALVRLTADPAAEAGRWAPPAVQGQVSRRGLCLTYPMARPCREASTPAREQPEASTQAVMAFASRMAQEAEAGAVTCNSCSYPRAAAYHVHFLRHPLLIQ